MQGRIEKILKFEGLIAATFTAFNDNGEIATADIPKYADHLVNNGVAGIFLNGTTGESVSLSISERKTSLEKWIEASKGRLLIIVQVGANCILDAKELAQHAEKHGADAIATIPPIYYRPNNNEELATYLKEISSAAPNLPLVYYHIPKLTAVHVSMNSFLPEAKKQVPNLCGAKYTSTDLADLTRCQASVGDRFKLMLGAEDILLGVLPFGINSFIGISFNTFAPLVNQIISKFKSSDLTSALKHQRKLVDILDTIQTHGSLIPALKETMNILTDIPVGDPRLPLCPLSKSKKAALKDTLKDLGF